MANKVQLPPEVAAKYDLINWVGSARQDFGKFGIVDISTMTIARADSLFKKGWKKLELKQKAVATTEKSDKK